MFEEMDKRLHDETEALQMVAQQIEDHEEKKKANLERIDVLSEEKSELALKMKEEEEQRAQIQKEQEEREKMFNSLSPKQKKKPATTQASF